MPAKHQAGSPFSDFVIKINRSPPYSLYSLPFTLSEKIHVEPSPSTHHSKEEVGKIQRIISPDKKKKVFPNEDI